MKQRLAANTLQGVIQEVGIDLALQRVHLRLCLQHFRRQFLPGIAKIMLLVQQVSQKRRPLFSLVVFAAVPQPVRPYERRQQYRGKREQHDRGDEHQPYG